MGSYRWSISSGTYDPNTKTTSLNLDGKIRCRLYCDPKNMANCALESAFIDPKVIISPDGQIESGTYLGIARGNAGGMPEEHKGAPAILNIRTTNPETTDNVTVWNDIPSICGEELIFSAGGADPDPVSFTYPGPSGKPVFPDDCAEPMSPMYEKTHVWNRFGALQRVLLLPDRRFHPTGHGPQPRSRRPDRPGSLRLQRIRGPERGQPRTGCRLSARLPGLRAGRAEEPLP